jgi:hypothetical protein
MCSWKERSKNHIQPTRILYELQTLKPVTGLVRNKHWIRNNERQPVNVHEQSLQILSCDWRQVDNLISAGVDPKITWVDSLETVSAERTWLRASTPKATKARREIWSQTCNASMDQKHTTIHWCLHELPENLDIIIWSWPYLTRWFWQTRTAPKEDSTK